MDAAASSSATITCAKPGCGAQTTLAEATYIDGCGHICPDCAGPLPAWWDDITAPAADPTTVHAKVASTA